MKIKKMTACFGALDGRTLELSDGLNILRAPNESGKSTWCAFLRVMLYGLNTAQRAKAGQKPDKIKYRPWSGAAMSGGMDVETPSGPVTLRRWTERAGQPMQAFSATVTGTDMPAPGLTSDTAGQILTGVPQPVFERSAFIRQAGLEISGDPELDRRIGAIVSSGDEEVSYVETDRRLNAWLRRRRSGRRGAIPELEAEIEALNRTLEELRQSARAAEELEAEIEALERRREQAQRRMQDARASQRKEALAELSGARSRTQEAEKARQTAAEALAAAEKALDGTPYGDMGPEEAGRRSEKDMESAGELLRLAQKLPPVKIAFIPLAAAALAFILAVFLPWKVECAGVGCILILLFVVMYTRLVSIRKTKEDTLADRERILTAYGVTEPEEIAPLLENYRTLWKERERAAFRLEEADAALEKARILQKDTEGRAVSALDFVNGDSQAARSGRELEEVKARLAELKERRAAAQGRAGTLGDPLVLESELAEKRRRYEDLLAQEEALNLAIDVMAQADGELQSRFSPRLAKRAAELFSRLTGGRYDEITLARDLTAKARRTGDAVGWETDYLSGGAKDQLYLALRLAVCELALPEDDPCPLVLDDALAAFDQARMERALALLKEISQTRQILLFTCHEREYDYFQDDPAVTTLTLG